MPRCSGVKVITAIRDRSLSCATKPRPTPSGATDSHNHTVVVATDKGRLHQRHSTPGARGIRINAAKTGNLCQYRPAAGNTPHNPSLVFLATSISRHIKYTERSDCAAISPCAKQHRLVSQFIMRRFVNLRNVSLHKSQQSTATRKRPIYPSK
jgi:hypothetical protein